MNKLDRIKLMMGQAALGRAGRGAATHSTDDEWKWAGLHLDALVIETLTGVVDNANVVFYSTFVPVPSANLMTLCLFRGISLTRDDANFGYRQFGREWHLSQTPSDQVVTDANPIGIYLRQPGAFEGDHDPATMGTGWRRHSEMPEPARRQWRRI